jgi:hypothetical protein
VGQAQGLNALGMRESMIYPDLMALSRELTELEK